jgi:hypothetical protein
MANVWETFCLQCHKTAQSLIVCPLEDADESIPITYLPDGKSCLLPGSKKSLLWHVYVPPVVAFRIFVFWL